MKFKFTYFAFLFVIWQFYLPLQVKAGKPPEKDTSVSTMPFGVYLTGIKKLSLYGQENVFAFWITKSGSISIAPISEFKNYGIPRRNPLSFFEQLTEIAIDDIPVSNSVYFYSDSLPYISSVATVGYFGRFLDSIPQAAGIKGLALNSSGVRFACIHNNQSNYLAKRDNAGKWITIPIVYAANTTESNYFLWFFYAAVVIAALILILILKNNATKREIDSRKEKSETLEEIRLFKDSPLTLADKPQITEVENAILRIIRNPRTPLPMSIVINGTWGSGKSSIMNRVKETLDNNAEDKDRFITSWFNVWHQQNETSLLNAFLLKIINTYEQRFYRNGFQQSLGFRLKLLRTRFLKQAWNKQFLTVLSVAFIIYFFLLFLGWMLYPFFPQRLNFIKSLCVNSDKLFSNENLKVLGGLVVTVISLLFINAESKSSIGVLVNLISQKGFKLDAENADPGFREKFRKQYWEIMDAVGGKKLVVFVDDLDRIGGDKIFEMLEAINFISDIASKPDDAVTDSPNTYFVLGMYTQEVAKNLGKKLSEINGTDIPDDGKQEEKNSLFIKKGMRYIEKMVQLSVSVPFNTAQLKELNSEPFSSQNQS